MTHVDTDSEPREKFTILIIDDEEEVLFTVSEIIDSLGYNYVTSLSVSNAKSHLQETTKVDAVLTDVQLKGGETGYDVANIILERRLRIPIVMMSGYFNQKSFKKRHSLENYPLIKKPFMIDEIDRILSTVLKKKEPAEQSSAG